MKAFIKSQTILCISFLLALLSCFLVLPNEKYGSYIDFRVLGILFGLMLIMAGFQNIGVFNKICSMIIQKTKNIRQLILIFVFLCFFTSMFITNDAALITFVPLAIFTLSQANCEDKIIGVVVLQTLAANLGSMLMPSGNPQNLYLYNLSGMSMGEFILLMLPYSILSLLLISVFSFFFKNQETVKLKESSESFEIKQKIFAILYSLLFAAGIMTICRLLSWEIFCIVCAIIMFFCDRKVFLKVDYSLLMTFVCFFIFIGNISNIKEVHSFLGSLVQNHELLISILSSQIISNVPAALMLSGFTENYKQLIIGTNFGGLGTLIASMASLISYKAIAEKYPENRKKYILLFTFANLIFLTLLYMEYLILS